MRKLIDFGKSPWPMLISMALGVVVAVLTTLDWSYSQSRSAPTAEPPLRDRP